ncbi:MAG: hypothetical protein KatS3mg061_0820 [Dehalococcoidia bacterium]|nr:MAG: hypothetical protein KatS3mg061_0820 [Dehalococcoidia bacterium]
MKPAIRLLPLVLYIATIFAANWAITTFGLVPVGFGLLAPAGVYFAGLAFTLRDLTHEALGTGVVVVAILVGALLSALISPQVAPRERRGLPLFRTAGPARLHAAAPSSLDGRRLLFERRRPGGR